MEKTLQAQYNLIQEGKGDKAYFLKSAYRLFPDMLSQINSFSDTVTILKNRGVISEGIGGVVTTGKKQDWMSIFNENMGSMNYDSWKKELIDIIKKDANLDDNEIAIDEEEIKRYYKEGKSPNEVYNNIWLKDAGNFLSLNESKEAKAIEKETTKEVTDMATRGYDYKDEKNYDNLFGQEFLEGYYAEMKDPKNADKDVEELRAIVAKNLAKDISYYVKDGQFGVKGLGYTTEAPGLGEPKEPKGKFKSSGYGDLKESVLRLTIQDIIKEVIAEISKDEAIEAGKGDVVVYKKDGNEVESVIINLSLGSGDPLPTAELENGDKINLGDVIELRKKAMLDLDKEWKGKLETGDIDEANSLNEALDMDAIKNEGEDAKKKVMERRITNEIVKRKKQIKALETLTELEEESGDNTKKVKELQSEIKKLEGAKAKLDGKKKVKEAGEKTAMVTTQSGETTAVDYKTPDELNKLKDNTDIKGIKTGAGQKVK